MRIQAYLLLVIATTSWSLNFIIGKVLTGVVPPLTINFFRWIATFFIYLILNWKEVKINWKNYRIHWKLLIFLVLTGYCVNGLTVYCAVHHTTAINASLLTSFNPIMFALVAYFVYGEKINLIQGVGIVISLLGVLWIIFQGDLGRMLGLTLNTGDLLMIISVLSWALYSVVYRQKANEFQASILFTILLIGAVILNLQLSVVENLIIGTEWLGEINGKHLLGLVALNIFPTFLAFNCWNTALKIVSSSEASIFLNLLPVTTTLISVAFLGEELLFSSLLGGLFIFCGIFLVTNSHMMLRCFGSLKESLGE